MTYRLLKSMFPPDIVNYCIIPYLGITENEVKEHKKLINKDIKFLYNDLHVFGNGYKIRLPFEWKILFGTRLINVGEAINCPIYRECKTKTMKKGFINMVIRNFRDTHRIIGK